jgi:hypothetical protein
MRKRSLIILSATWIIGAIYVMWVGFLGSPVVTIRNEASSAISNIVLSGTGYRTIIPHVEPGDSVTVVLHPTGEAGIRVEFSSPAGQKLSDVGYIEPRGGYCDDLTFTPDYEVLFKSNRLGCFSLQRII